jgi:hypothetical protein
MRYLQSAITASLMLTAGHTAFAADASQVIQATPDLVGFWDFSEAAGSARLSKGTPQAHALLEQGGPITRFDEGPISGYSAYLNGTTQFFSIVHELTGDLNISGPTAQVSMIAFIKQTQMSKTIAGIWSEGSGAGDLSGVRQYALLQDMPTYGGDDKVTPHISANGGPSQRKDGSYLPWNADYAASQSTVAINEWVSVGFTYDGTWVKAFYNGVFEQWTASPSSLGRTDSYFTQEGPNNDWRGINAYYQPDGIYTFDPNDPIKQDTGAPFTVGARQAVGKPVAEPFKGYFGGLAVFDRGLSESEMMAMHNAAFAVEPPPPPPPSPTYLFEEPFAGVSGSNVSINTFNSTTSGANWNTAWGSTALSTNGTTSGSGIRLADSTVAPAHFLAFVGESSDRIGFAWTTDVSIDVDDVASLSVRLNNKLTDDRVRFAVQINGQWYVTDASFGIDPAGIAFNNWSNAQPIDWTWDSSANAWRLLNLVEGSGMSLGSLSSLDRNGTIEAFGLFGEVAANGLIRADDLRITEVPEPTTIALLAAAMLMGSRRHRKC